MAKLHFKYGAMNCGKTTILLQTVYNYESKKKKVIIMKSIVDTKGGTSIVSRLGISRKVDYIIKSEESVIKRVSNVLKDVDCVLVDEVQFFTPNQIVELWEIAKLYNIPVICYGLRSDFQINGFPGSVKLFTLADELIEIPTICRCGKKARFNCRKENGVFVNKGDQVAIDGENNVTYEALCGDCYLKEFGKISRN